MSSDAKTFQQMWKQMEPARRRQIATAFFSGTESAGEQRRAAGMIAMKLKLRPQKAAKLPADKLAGYLSSIMSVDEPLAALVIRDYLFAEQRSMLVMFLDALGITHKDGVIPDGTETVPTTEALREAIAKVRAGFAPEDVDLYLSALIASDGATWANLQAALSE